MDGKTSTIEKLIDGLEEYIESCKPKMLSKSEIIVNKDEMDGWIREMRNKAPEEIRRCQKIISREETILKEAQAKAQKLVEDAARQTNDLISQQDVIAQAYEQARDIVDTAARQAQEILNKAVLEANELRTQASSYTEELLRNLEDILLSAIESSVSNYDRLIGSLGQYRDRIQSNLRDLSPAESLGKRLADEEDDDRL